MCQMQYINKKLQLSTNVIYCVVVGYLFDLPLQKHDKQTFLYLKNNL